MERFKRASQQGSDDNGDFLLHLDDISSPQVPVPQPTNVTGPAHTIRKILILSFCVFVKRERMEKELQEMESSTITFLMLSAKKERGLYDLATHTIR